jgi:hypothetical protein
MQKGTTSKGMEANKNFGKWLSCGIQISGTFGLHHVLGLSSAAEYGFRNVAKVSLLPSSCKARGKIVKCTGLNMSFC